MNKQQTTIHIFNSYVKEYMHRFFDLNLYKQTFDYLLTTLPAGASVLELGCGPGNVINYIKSQRVDLRILGIDLAPQMIEAAKKMNPGSEFQVMDIRNISEIQEHFDVVIAAFCIPYLSPVDVEDLFKQMNRLTTVKNGMIYISCMKGRRERSGYEQTSFTGSDKIYINYYTSDEIELLINKNDFVIKKSFTQDYPEADGSSTIDLIYIAQRCKS